MTEEALVNPQAEYTSVGSAAQLAPVLEAQAEQPEYTFFLRPKDNLVIMANLKAKHEHSGGVFAQFYVTYDAIGCRHGADRNQVGPMAIAQFEVNSYPQVSEAEARQLHPELFAYLAEKYGYGVAQEEAAPAPRKPGRKSAEPTQKRDFRFPVSLLDALKAASEEDGQTMTEFLMSLLKSDKRIQNKLGVMTEDEVNV